MNIHIETLLQRLEDLDKKHPADLAYLETRITEFLREKSRLDEFLNLREKELKKVKDESGQALSLLDRPNPSLSNKKILFMASNG